MIKKIDVEEWRGVSVEKSDYVHSAAKKDEMAKEELIAKLDQEHQEEKSLEKEEEREYGRWDDDLKEGELER